MTQKDNEIQWRQLHEEIKELMQQELTLSRELLANMHEEELALMMRDQRSWTLVMQMRSSMIERLSTLRTQRQQTTQKIYPLLSLHATHPSLEEIFPLNEEISHDIFNLRDQLMALTERMNRQQHRNSHLEEHLKFQEQPSALRPRSFYPPELKQKKKANVATYTIKK